MFERFTPGARKAVVISQELARSCHQDVIEPVHLLLGTLGANDPDMGALLDRLGLDSGDVVEQVSAIVQTGTADLTGHIPFHEGTKMVIADSLKQALALGDKEIRTTHLLLGLLHIDRGPLSDVLAKLGITTASVTAALGAGGSDGAGATFQVRTTKGLGRFRRGGKSDG